MSLTNFNDHKPLQSAHATLAAQFREQGGDFKMGRIEGFGYVESSLMPDLIGGTAEFRGKLLTGEIGRINDGFSFVTSPAVGVSTGARRDFSGAWERMVAGCIDASARLKAQPPAYPSMASGMWSLRKPVAAAAARLCAGEAA